MKQHFLRKIATAFMILCLATIISSCGLNSENYLSETSTDTTIEHTEKITLSDTTESTTIPKNEPIISTAKSPEPSESTNSSSEMYFKEPEPETIVYDEEHGLSYVKNQLLISTSPDTDRSKIVEMLSTGDYGEVQIVGEIALTGDYQVEFSDDHSLSEMQEIADYYLVFPFVENVTLNIISETAPAESEVSEVEDGWIAKLNGGSGEITYHTYVYEAENGYKYINTTSTTVSYGSPQWTERVIDSGSVSTKEEIVQVAKDNGSKQYVLFPDDKEDYKISDFLNMD